MEVASEASPTFTAFCVAVTFRGAVFTCAAVIECVAISSPPETLGLQTYSIASLNAGMEVLVARGVKITKRSFVFGSRHAFLASPGAGTIPTQPRNVPPPVSGIPAISSVSENPSLSASTTAAPAKTGRARSPTASASTAMSSHPFFVSSFLMVPPPFSSTIENMGYVDPSPASVHTTWVRISAGP